MHNPDTPVALDSAGELHLQTVTTTEQTSSTGQASNLAWQRMQNQGQIDETTHYNQLGNNVEIKAAHITAQMSVQDSAQALAQEPGMGWIKQLSEDPQLSAKVNWQQVQEAHDKWNYKKQGLTPAAAAVVAIVVAYFTAGAGTSLVGATGSVAADAAINAAVSTLASQATVSAINNGGDIALHLEAGERMRIAVVPDISEPHAAHDPGKRLHLNIDAANPVRGVATSGWPGRSFSLGIADSVTILALTAAQADAAATAVANAVNVDHPLVVRRPARELQPDSDLGDRLVTVAVPALPETVVHDALDAGEAKARELLDANLIAAAVLVCQGRVRMVGRSAFILQPP